MTAAYTACRLALPAMVEDGWGRVINIASVVAEAQAGVEREVRLPPGYFVTWGGQFENLERASRRLSLYCLRRGSQHRHP